MEILSHQINSSSVECVLCPRHCHLSADTPKGWCGIRQYEHKTNSVINPYSGVISAESVDMIEKKPLYHFLPGTMIYSIGFYGCTLQCIFCQNHSISQKRSPSVEHIITPESMLHLLIKNGFTSIAFTYSEPLLYYEWVYETAKLCKSHQIKTVLVTNGYINKPLAEKLLPFIDAVNIDLKSFSDTFYRTLLSGTIEPVKEFIKLSIAAGVHTEITTLVIPGKNDSEKEIREAAQFIAGLSLFIPYHLSAYHPAYQMTVQPTRPESLKKLAALAAKELAYVYIGNIAATNVTKCRKCGTTLVTRTLHTITTDGLDPAGKCKICGTDNYFVT